MFTPEEQNMDVETAIADEKMAALITDICGHYTFEEPAVKEQLQTMEENLRKRYVDGHAYAVKKVRDAIERYAFLFRLYGLTGKLLAL